MGRDKTQLRLGRRTLLEHVIGTAASLTVPVRVIRRDLYPRCGPLGGIFTALSTSRVDAELFMASDMPFVRPSLLAQLLSIAEQGAQTIFLTDGTRVGFPFLLPVTLLDVVEKQLRSNQFSLQSLADAAQATLIKYPSPRDFSWLNVNTPDDWIEARKAWLKMRSGQTRAGKKVVGML
jgi:molybdopterin-guanine dinucleotide biosynthesis protein A